MMKILLLTIVAGVILGAESCSDRQPEASCKYWKTTGFCSESHSKYHCEKTCGFCSTGGNGGSNNGQCGVSKVQQGRVVNGVDAQPGAWPWIASLQRYSSHFCGGTLITPNWVLTASHCVEGIKQSNMQQWSVVLGAHDHRSTESSAQRIQIKRVIVHPMYKSRGMTYDVTLLELVSPARLNDRVVLGCLPQQGVYPSVGKQCYIAGWGSINHPGGVHHTLQQARLPVVQRGHKGCHNNKDMVCVGRGFDAQPDGKQHPNACRGDSGGPLVCQQSDGRWQLEGVASYVYTYCKYYTAYAPVNKFIDWINSYVG